jgi:hypothetical protein
LPPLPALALSFDQGDHNGHYCRNQGHNQVMNNLAHAEGAVSNHSAPYASIIRARDLPRWAGSTIKRAGHPVGPPLICSLLFFYVITSPSRSPDRSRRRGRCRPRRARGPRCLCHVTLIKALDALIKRNRALYKAADVLYKEAAVAELSQKRYLVRKTALCAPFARTLSRSLRTLSSPPPSWSAPLRERTFPELSRRIR